jgi:hypothetical protein
VEYVHCTDSTKNCPISLSHAHFRDIEMHVALLNADVAVRTMFDVIVLKTFALGAEAGLNKWYEWHCYI